MSIQHLYEHLHLIFAKESLEQPKFLISRGTVSVPDLRSRKKLMGQSKEFNQQRKELKSFDICVSVIFSCYDQSVIFGRESGNLALSLTEFENFLIFS